MCFHKYYPPNPCRYPHSKRVLRLGYPVDLMGLTMIWGGVEYSNTAMFIIETPQKLVDLIHCRLSEQSHWSWCLGKVCAEITMYQTERWTSALDIIPLLYLHGASLMMLCSIYTPPRFTCIVTLLQVPKSMYRNKMSFTATHLKILVDSLSCL